MSRSKNRRSRGQNRTARNRGTQSNWFKTVGIAALPLAMLSFGGFALNHHIKQPKPIEGTRCYLQSGQHQSAMLVDFSLTLQTSALQQKDLRTALVRAYDALPPNGQLSLFTTARDSAGGALAVPDYSDCRPAGNPEEQAIFTTKSDTQIVLSNQARTARQEYLSEIDQLIASSLDATKIALDSPILESIQSISRYYEGRRLNRLGVYSDGVQNSELLHFCRVAGHMPPLPRFVKLSEYQLIKPAPFDGTQVDMLLVETHQYPSPGAEHCTNNELRAFYPAFFEFHGAQAQLTRIRHGIEE